MTKLGHGTRGNRLMRRYFLVHANQTIVLAMAASWPSLITFGFSRSTLVACLANKTRSVHSPTFRGATKDLPAELELPYADGIRTQDSGNNSDHIGLQLEQTSAEQERTAMVKAKRQQGRHCRVVQGVDNPCGSETLAEPNEARPHAGLHLLVGGNSDAPGWILEEIVRGRDDYWDDRRGRRGADVAVDDHA